MPSRESSRKRILVVGGVAGGMSFAARARRLDEHAEIIVFEKGEHPSFANCGLPYFVSGEIERERSLLVQTPESLRAALDIDVRVGHVVHDADPDRRVVRVYTGGSDTELVEFPYDELVLAPGTVTGWDDVPGVQDLMRSGRARTLRTVDDARAIHELATDARSAVVLGGGYIGVEAAEALRLRGLDVHLVQRGTRVLPRVDLELAGYVADALAAHGVTVTTGVTAVAYAVTDDGIAIDLASGETLRADLVVNATGGRVLHHFIDGIELDDGRFVVDEHGRTSIPHVWAVGDAVTHIDPVTGARRPVELAGPANRDARLLADAMLGTSARSRPAALGTSVVRVFDQTVAMTGANAADLDRAGIAFESVSLHAGSHAGYFPGSETIHLVLHFVAEGPERGRILGAQAVGRDGVDKRIDVIATAMRGGLRADDLIDLDLAYAPPYGSAKDPVNMAGFVADNVLTGLTKHWYAKDLDVVREQALILDVRRRDEWDRGHLDGAMHVPHTELRERLDEVIKAAAGRPIRAHCAAGMRSYLAHRILSAAGLDSASLSGGMQTLVATHGKGILK